MPKPCAITPGFIQQFQARQTAKREAAEGNEANSLREQLDQSLRRLSEAQNGAAETTR